MATESDLRDLLHGPDPKGRGAIDLDAVLSRTRRRRRPRVIAAQALGSVALVGLLGTVIVVAIPGTDQNVMMTAEDAAGGAAESAPEADESASRWMPDACGAPVTEYPTVPGLELEIVIEATFEPGPRVPITVTLHNEGTERVTGTTGPSPFLTFSRDGTVVWHSPTAQDTSVLVVDLAPGESMSYSATFDRVLCASEEQLATGSSTEDLPRAGPGVYELHAVIQLSPADGTDTLIVTGPQREIEVTG